MRGSTATESRALKASCSGGDYDGEELVVITHMPIVMDLDTFAPGPTVPSGS